MFFTPLLQGAAQQQAAPAAPSPAIFRKSVPWTRQPQGPVEIDWSNPLTRGLVRLAGLGGSDYDPVTGSFATRNGTVDKTVDGYKMGTSSGSSLALKDAPLTRYTAFAIAYAYTAGGEPRVICRSGSSPAFDQNYCLNLNFGTTPRAGHKQVSDNAYRYVQSSISVTSGQRCTLASTYDGSDIRVYTNGRFGGSISASDSFLTATNVETNVGASDGTLRVGCYQGRGILFAAIWNRALTASEIAKISANPWQIFKPVTRTIAAVISGVTISRPSSDITVTGWIGDPDNANLYNNIDEVSPNDADFIISPGLAGSPGPAVFGISPTQATGSLTVRVRARYAGASGQIRVLMQDASGVTVGTSSWQVLTATPTTYNLDVTTSATAARVRLEVQP